MADMMKKYKKKMREKTRIHPSDDNNEDVANEMDSIDEQKANNKKQLKFGKTVNAVNFIANIKTSTSRWRRYVNSKRRPPLQGAVIDRKNTGGLGLEGEIGSNDIVDGGSLSVTQQQMVIDQNRNLIQYFAKLGQSKSPEDTVNLEYIEGLIKNGAHIDCTDKFGQTVFHEVARTWHVDVARFLIDNKANINQADIFGRTPLHVAAAVDYPEMVAFLIENGANKESLTKNEQQTPVHFAARNDACASLQCLVKQGCEYKNTRDYKGRTPLHLAAELDRSETARLLLELDDPAPAGVVDNSNQAAIVWMITKMPPVAKVALDQFHTMDRANRRQYYHLHKLEPKTLEEKPEAFPQSALRMCVRNKRFDLILHPSLFELIRVKWGRFGRSGAILSLFINLLFILLWSAQGIFIEYDKRHLYVLPSQWWRILLFVMAIILTIYQLKEELTEFFTSRKAHKQWRDWREKELDRDIELAHPRWPEERAYLEQEKEYLDNLQPQYFNDFWNIYDWICYTFLLVVIITHLVDVFNHTHFISRLHIRIMSVTIILLWLRLMKNVRAFSLLGPFIVMLAHMLSDIIKFAFLYLQFYLPFACAFWMIFGENKVPEQYQGLPGADNYTVTVDGFATADALFFSLFRITLVDDYDYAGMKSVDSIMADILVGTWLALSAILMLNLFIALLSDTFQRVYDNAKANAVMQKAIFILNLEEGMNSKRREKFRTYIHTKCAPEEDYYDDDTTEPGGDDLKKVTFQIKDQIEDLKELIERNFSSDDQVEELKEDLKSGKYLNNLDEGSGGESDGGGGQSHRGRRHSETPAVSRSQLKKLVTTKKLEQELDVLRDDVLAIRENQERMMGRLKKEVVMIRGLLQQLVGAQGGVSPGVGIPRSGSLGSIRQLSRHASVISAGQVGDLQQEYGTSPTASYRTAPHPQQQSYDPAQATYGSAGSQTYGSSVLPPGVAGGPLGSSVTHSGAHPPSRGRVLSATMEEDDWEESERQRKEDLDALRKRLADQARNSLTGENRPPITPMNTTEPNEDQPRE